MDPTRPRPVMTRDTTARPRLAATWMVLTHVLALLVLAGSGGAGLGLFTAERSIRIPTAAVVVAVAFLVTGPAGVALVRRHPGWAALAAAYVLIPLWFVFGG